MTALSPLGTARGRFLASQGVQGDAGSAWVSGADVDDFEPTYLGWEIARCAAGLSSDEKRAIGSLVAASVVALRAGSTRLPLDDVRLAPALAPFGASEALALLRPLIARARQGDPSDPVSAIVGRAGERKPLVIEGDWLYAQHMRTLEDRFCGRVRDRLERKVTVRDAKSLGRVLRAIAAGPPALTDEQQKAVREALCAPLALITGGPGTGKTTIVVALLRALAWLGEPMETIAIGAPTGKAAQRLRDAIASGLASAPGDLAFAALKTAAPVPQTLHRLLGWSPARRRFARHENDRLPHRVVVVDEASMVDLGIMDRLLRALADDARLVLLGDADQLPSVEAGAVFRDLCGALAAVHLSANLRVARDPSGRRIVSAAAAVNRGSLDATFHECVATHTSVERLSFDGVEHLAAPWAEVGNRWMDRFWHERIAPTPDFARRVSRTYRLRGASFAEADHRELHALLDHHASVRILCATRVRPLSTSAEALNEDLVARLARVSSAGGRYRSAIFAPGTPVVAERNDYERLLFNGDQGVVVRVDSGDDEGVELMAVFRQGDVLRAFSVEALGPLAPCFAMTVHKAQGSEFDHVVLVLPEVELPLLTRELVYTAMTRARRSVLFVGAADLLARAVSRVVDRHSGVGERLGFSPR